MATQNIILHVITEFDLAIRLGLVDPWRRECHVS